MKSLLLSTSLFVVACLNCSLLSQHRITHDPGTRREPGLAVSEFVTNAQVGPRNTILTLTRGRHEIVEHDPTTAKVIARYSTTEKSEFTVRRTVDFSLDDVGILHALLLVKGRDGKPYTVIRRFQDGETFTDVVLDQVIDAEHFDIAGSGHYHVLGFAGDQLRSATEAYQRGSVGPAHLFLVHEVRPDGSWVASCFPVSTPGDLRSLTRTMRTVSISDLAVVGETPYLLWQQGPNTVAGKPHLNPLELTSSLLTVDDSGATKEMELMKPAQISAAFGLLKWDAELTVKWIIGEDSGGPERPGIVQANSI